jgi:hypothetical protein
MKLVQETIRPNRVKCFGNINKTNGKLGLLVESRFDSLKHQQDIEISTFAFEEAILKWRKELLLLKVLKEAMILKSFMYAGKNRGDGNESVGRGLGS